MICLNKVLQSTSTLESSTEVFFWMICLIKVLQSASTWESSTEKRYAHNLSSVIEKLTIVCCHKKIAVFLEFLRRKIYVLTSQLETVAGFSEGSSKHSLLFLLSFITFSFHCWKKTINYSSTIFHFLHLLKTALEIYLWCLYFTYNMIFS